MHSREEIVSPENCILCHRPRRDPKDALLKEQKPLPESPYCQPCFTATAPYYRESLTWARRQALAQEDFTGLLNELSGGILDAVSIAAIGISGKAEPALPGSE